MKVLAIAGSGRRGGNTDIMLNEFLAAIPKGRHEVTTLRAPLDIKPCVACDYCLSGKCIQQDSMQAIYPAIDEADFIVVATPIYFYSLPGHLKSLIDRGQLFYNRKYVLKKGSPKKKKGVLLSCSGRTKANMFDGAILTVKTWFDSLDCEYLGGAFFPGVDHKGDIKIVSGALDEVRALAARHLSD